ncbi:hypothetical protein BDQ12DRAFT_684353 [Crucibulum laeve]|uniref:Uncharacterized protein n=1 Tax=Crucibulum laeve TaxID=68775 RepID=A0A5C3LZ00_9AGAR|nr:hypothetical protein BDQ12DRAFT_684353 [Crucibulum laeve]
MSAPPIPPRPYDSYYGDDRQNSLPPPLPPLPPAVRVQEERYNTPSIYEYPSYESPPHFGDPLVAPRPHRLDPNVGANMARQLDDQLYPQQPDYRRPSPGPISTGFPAAGGQRAYSPLPPPQGAGWSPWGGPPQQPPPPHQHQGGGLPYPGIGIQGSGHVELTQSMANMSFSNQRPAGRTQSTFGASPPNLQTPLPAPSYPTSPYPASSNSNSSASSSNGASLTATLPTLPLLQSAVQVVQQPSHDPGLKITWCRDVFFLVDRTVLGSAPTSDPPTGPLQIPDPALERLTRVAVPLVLQLASAAAPQPGNPTLPPHVAEAIYLRAMFTASGAYPQYIERNPKAAFRDFEAAARGGYAGAWFRLGRDYENFGDFAHAKDCFEKGVKLAVESCTYRMGMAHLLGQLGLPSNPAMAIPLLHRAATIASLEVPQPAYVYALLLLSEFSQVAVPASLFAPYVPKGSSPTLEARKHLERAAYLHFAPAQYKLGHAYEFAQPPFPFDPLLSVQYYSLAAQGGETEADMALSKWFLCGSGETPGGDGFEKDEGLARTFAEKAARRGLPSAEFAMGYYFEVGVGGGKDVREAVRWYTLARDHGNTDAAERLAALSQPSPQSLSRQEHDNITESKLVRKRTQAKQRSETQPMSPPYDGMTFPGRPTGGPSVGGPGQGQGGGQGRPGPRRDGKAVLDVARRTSMLGYPPGALPPQQQQRGKLDPVQEYPAPGSQQQPQQHPHHANTLPPGAAGGGHPSIAASSSSPMLRPQKQQSYPAQQRYTLSDAPSPASSSSSGPSQGGRNSSPSRPAAGYPSSPGVGNPPGRAGRAHGRYPSGPSALGGDPVRPPSAGAATGGGGGGSGTSTPGPGKGPTTFAEMGFHGAKADDKDCVIM